MDMIQASVLQVLILTKNEEPNICRVLRKLGWVERVVILDSFSTDSTLQIAKSFANVEVHQRPFDTFAQQWNYGLNLINSEWLLNLDADYVLPDEFIEEARLLVMNDDKSRNAYYSHFKFLIYGRELIRNNTTPRSVLFRRTKGHFYDDGHTQRLEVEGEAGYFKHSILHDDRKSLSRWLSNQDSYSISECAKLLDPNSMNAKSTLNIIRRTKIFAPILVFFYCSFYKRLLLNGWAGWYYILQRTMVEMLWALRMIENEKFNIKLETTKVSHNKMVNHNTYNYEVSESAQQSLPDAK